MSGSPAVDSSLSGRGGDSVVSEARDSVARCKGPGVRPPAGNAPWRGDPRAADKDRLCRYLCENPDGVPLSRLAELVSGERTGDSGSRAYTFVSRFVHDSEHFRVISNRPRTYSNDGESRELGKSVWVEPRASAFTCLRRKHHLSNPPKPQDSTGTKSGSDRKVSEFPSKFAKARARSYLSRHTQIHSDSVRHSLASELATELSSIEGKVTVLERTSDRSDLPEHLLVPYTTRFNSLPRASESRERFDRAWREASESHSSAVMATLTTDPDLHDSALEAADALTDTLQDLRRWLARDVSAEWAPDRVGRSLPYVSALEWTETGLPHLHIVFFGARSLCSQGALSDYLSDKTGRVVWLDSLTSRGPGGRWLWSNPRERPDDASAATQPREYLSEALRGQQRLAGMTAGEVSDAVDSGDLSLWRQALYWASGKQLWTASEGLQSTSDAASVVDPGLPAVSQYEYVGTAYYADLPGYIKRTGELLGRPPPPPDG